MKKIKACFSKECLKKAMRTFLQTAIGYVLANLSLYFGGMDFSDGTVIKTAAAGLLMSAFSAGAAAVMNMEKGDKQKDG